MLLIIDSTNIGGIHTAHKGQFVKWAFEFVKGFILEKKPF